MVAEISVKQDGMVDISGELTFATVTPLYQSIPDHFSMGKDFIIDFSRVGNCDSASLVLLIGIVRYLKQQNKHVQFVHLPQTVLTLVQLYNLQELISMQPNLSHG